MNKKNIIKKKGEPNQTYSKSLFTTCSSFFYLRTFCFPWTNICISFLFDKRRLFLVPMTRDTVDFCCFFFSASAQLNSIFVRVAHKFCLVTQCVSLPLGCHLVPHHPLVSIYLCSLCPLPPAPCPQPTSSSEPMTRPADENTEWTARVEQHHTIHIHHQIYSVANLINFYWVFEYFLIVSLR